MITKQKTTEQFDWEFCNYLLDLKEEWKKSTPRLTDKEWLEIFPEARVIIPEKITEWEEKRTEFFDTIKKKLTLIKHQISDDFSQWFWREWVKVNEGEELLKIDGHISRLKRLIAIAKGTLIGKRGITDEMIEQALNTPIETLISQPLRKSGKALVGLCPFHQEKTPSFFVYPESNSFYCFGCNQGGNVINFVRLLGYSFKEAVQFLIGEK